MEKLILRIGLPGLDVLLWGIQGLSLAAEQLTRLFIFRFEQPVIIPARASTSIPDARRQK